MGRSTMLIATACSLVFLLCSQGVWSMINLADTPCGKIARGSRRFHQRILGGSEVHISEFPHSVSLRKDGEHFCGGVLVHKHYVLTAAHCVHNRPPKVWQVAVGEQNTVKLDGTEQLMEVEQIIEHPDYIYPKLLNDIAIIRIDKPVIWNKMAQPVCLPDPLRRTAKGLGYLAGWGYDNESKKGGVPTETLHMARIPILENDVCESWLMSQGKSISLAPTHLCAGHEFGAIDGCQADSGGGLVSVDDDQLLVVGIMSAGIGCGREKMPGLYTRVEKFIPWIQSEIKGGARIKRGTDQDSRPNPKFHWWDQLANE
ncbi:hypothetical protein TCAL_01904 [Tigriopus californicus]|uniref:Peptidase S1 domain-containing protein n=1 Tax=Tigriopus californicus TaxID=6832 RepID=A0A553P841_TIGCA|nr:serine protease 33-like [Tigriopus californicus]TRY73855.1 hypothetical protein TCAL_01904 [Tigriopus californicus]